MHEMPQYFNMPISLALPRRFHRLSQTSHCRYSLTSRLLSLAGKHDIGCSKHTTHLSNFSTWILWKVSWLLWACVDAYSTIKRLQHTQHLIHKVTGHFLSIRKQSPLSISKHFTFYAQKSLNPEHYSVFIPSPEDGKESFAAGWSCYSVGLLEGYLQAPDIKAFFLATTLWNMEVFGTPKARLAACLVIRPSNTADTAWFMSASDHSR